MIHPIEHTDTEKLNQFTLAKIKAALMYLENFSPYYQRLFKDKNINTEINSLEDFAKIPCTTKDDLQNNNDDFLCVPQSEIAEWTTTSGTLGTPISFGLTQNDLGRLSSNEARSLAITGCKSSDVIQLMVTLDKRFMAGLAYYLGAQSFGCATVRVGSGSPGLQIDSLVRFKANVIIAVPSFLLKVLEFAEMQKTDLAEIQVEKIICIGEPVRKPDGSLNNLGARIKSKWPKTKLFSTYASTEMSTAITECEACHGGHIPADLVYVELLDDDGNPVPEGDAGEVTFTSYDVEAMPLLRYRTGDICKFLTSECSCGNKTKRLSPVLGRKKQMIKYKGTTLFPESIYELMNGIEWVKDYVIILETNDIQTDDLSVLMSVDEVVCKQNKLEYLDELFRTHIRVKPKIELKTPQEIRKIKFPSSSRKPLKLIDKRKIVIS